MLYLPITRQNVLQLLPTGGVCAEIGVFEGDFSKVILTQALPGVLHLIDPWTHQDREDYQADVANAADDVQTDRYAKILSKFETEIAAGNVSVHREFSCDAVERFEDGSLDWAYIDAVHSHAGALADLRAFEPKIKPGGFLLGHDFTNHPSARRMGFGVIEAVRDFLSESGWAFLALTAEVFPTFVLARGDQTPDSQLFLKECIYKIPGVVEIRNPFKADIQHREFRYSDNSLRYVMSF